MLDVVNGQERVRVWPKKKPKRLPEITKQQNEWFLQAQWATKYWPPALQAVVQRATHRTPLMPRDIMTMIMAGRAFAIDVEGYGTLWSTAAMADVSGSLDILAPVPGSVLTRGPANWQAAEGAQAGYVLTWQGPDQPAVWTPKGGSGGTGWNLAGIWQPAVDGAAANHAFVGLAGSNDIMILCRLVTFASSTVPVAEVSTDNGASFYGSTGDYQRLDTSGTETAVGGILLQGTNSTAARSSLCRINGASLTDGPRFIEAFYALGQDRLFVASQDPINAVRIRSNSGANFTGGTVYCFTR